MLSRLVLMAALITTGAIVLAFLVLTQSVHSNMIIAQSPDQTLPTFLYNCVAHCTPQQNAFMDGYKMAANHAVSGHVYDDNCSKDSHYCSVYQTGYARGWDKYIWAAEHTCYHCA